MLNQGDFMETLLQYQESYYYALCLHRQKMALDDELGVKLYEQITRMVKPTKTDTFCKTVAEDDGRNQTGKPVR